MSRVSPVLMEITGAAKTVRDVWNIGKLYHGTFRSRLSNILKGGLGAGTEKSYPQSKSGLVYLAENPSSAQSWAATAVNKLGDDIVVLEIDANQLDATLFDPDENIRIPEYCPECDTPVMDRTDPDYVCQWEECNHEFEGDHSYQYKGVIPPRAIKVTKHASFMMTIPLSAAVDVVDGIGNRAVKTAISLPDLVRQTNQFSKKWRGGCSPRLLDSNPKALFLHYNVKCQKEDSDPAGHDVRVQFDTTKVQESQKAKDLDVQVQCSCPAFLYWGAQWNLHQRDGLLGPARPALQAPKERLDLRGNYVICKHIHAVFERILPSVQHNIVNILRKREMERKKLELEGTPERLQKEKERDEKKDKLDEARKTKNKGIKDKLLNALRDEEEARMTHEKELEDQAPESVERDEPATEPHEHEEAPATPAPAKPAPEEQETADISDLTDQEEQHIEELHKENKPHIHKGLPYEEETEKESGMWKKIKDWAKKDWEGRYLKRPKKKSSYRKLASTDEPGLLWRAPEDNESHDYQPSWDYEPREGHDPELANHAVAVAKLIYQRTKQPFELWDVDLSGAVATYIDGTHGYPVILVDLEGHRGYEDQVGKSIDHELRHAIQESEGREYDEEEAETD